MGSGSGGTEVLYPTERKARADEKEAGEDGDGKLEEEAVGVAGVLGVRESFIGRRGVLGEEEDEEVEEDDGGGEGEERIRWLEAGKIKQEEEDIRCSKAERCE